MSQPTPQCNAGKESEAMEDAFVSLKLKYYTKEGHLLERKLIEVERDEPISVISDVVARDLLKVIGWTFNEDIIAKRDGRHSFLYTIGFRFAAAGFDGYLNASDDHQALNIDSTADLFASPTEHDSIDVIVVIEAREGPKTRKTWRSLICPSTPTHVDQYTFYRLGIANTSPKVSDQDFDFASRELTKDAEDRNRIATYHALLARRRKSAQADDYSIDLVSVPTHDFGDVCFGDCHAGVPDAHWDHQRHRYFWPFPGYGKFEELQWEVAKPRKAAFLQKWGLRVPVLPPYTWSGLQRGEAFEGVEWPEEGVDVGVQFINRLRTEPDAVFEEIVFPEDLVFNMRRETTAEICRKMILAAIRYAPQTTRRQMSEGWMSCADLFIDVDEEARPWDVELWVMQQAPAPRKMHLWLPIQGVRGDEELVANFDLLSCLSVQQTKKGDARIYMQAIVGARDARTWSVTGTEFTKHKSFPVVEVEEMVELDVDDDAEKVQGIDAESVGVTGHELSDGVLADGEADRVDSPQDDDQLLDLSLQLEHDGRMNDDARDDKPDERARDGADNQDYTHALDDDYAAPLGTGWEAEARHLDAGVDSYVHGGADGGRLVDTDAGQHEEDDHDDQESFLARSTISIPLEDETVGERAKGTVDRSLEHADEDGLRGLTESEWGGDSGGLAPTQPVVHDAIGSQCPSAFHHKVSETVANSLRRTASGEVELHGQ